MRSKIQRALGLSRVGTGLFSSSWGSLLSLTGSFFSAVELPETFIRAAVVGELVDDKQNRWVVAREDWLDDPGRSFHRAVDRDVESLLNFTDNASIVGLITGLDGGEGVRGVLLTDDVPLQLFILGISLRAKGSLVVADGTVQEALNLVAARVEDWSKGHFC